MKPTKTELLKIIRNYGTTLAGAEAFKAVRDRASYNEQVERAQGLLDQIDTALDTLCDDTEQVEWVTVEARLPEKGWPCWVSDGEWVVSIIYHGVFPYEGTTHWRKWEAPCPPRRMPQSPKGGEKDAD